MFDSPCPMNSWLPSMRWPVRNAIALAMEIDWVSDTMATATETPLSCPSAPGSRCGHENSGRRRAIGSSIVMPVWSPPNARFSPTATAPPQTSAMTTLGPRGRRRRTPQLTPIVTSATATTAGLISPSPRATSASVRANDAPCGTGMPVSGPTWLTRIRMPAPAVKPTMTGCEMKFTSRPRRSAPSASMHRPVRKASVAAICT